jgi:succinate dehydrogenase / fumarate reductase, cytochrome b subunit
MAIAAPRPVAWPLEIYRSALGKKVVMAVTGFIGIGFLVGHLVGNLKLYMGIDALDHYSHWLRTVGYPAVPKSFVVWTARLVLVGSVLLHIHAAYSLTVLNHRARPEKYSQRDYVAANYASRTMRWGGVIILLYILFHLADLTLGVEAANPEFVRGHVRDNLLFSLSRPPVAILYVVANLALGLHLFHGVWSMFQTLGFSHDRFDPWRKHFAIGLAGIITLGNISFPLAVLTGVVS